MILTAEQLEWLTQYSKALAKIGPVDGLYVNVHVNDINSGPETPVAIIFDNGDVEFTK